MSRSAVQRRISGLYGIADADASGGDPERIARAMLEGGCRLIQLRCKNWLIQDILRVARTIAPRCRAVDATLILNDHPEIVAESGAHGVHLGQLDPATETARALLPPGALIGRSTNDLNQIAQALLDLDYVAFGPVFSTENAGRPKTVRGVEYLAHARSLVPWHVPLVAIGGIDAALLPAVRQTGVSAWAVIGAITKATDPVAATRALLGTPGLA